MSRKVAAAAFLLAAAVPSTAIAAPCKAIHFPTGAHSTTISGQSYWNDDSVCYTVATAAGQTAQLRFLKTNGNTVFQFDGESVNDHASFTTQAKTYHFTVSQPVRGGPDSKPGDFTLEVSIR